MAIVTGIKKDDILLKFKKQLPFRRFNPDTEIYTQGNRDVFYLLKLDARRARTNGLIIEEPWMLPFLKAIKIKLIPQHLGNDGNLRWIAVGTLAQQVHEEVWNQTQSCEVAELHYSKKIFNQSLATILNKDPQTITPEQFEAWRNIQDDITPEEDIEWPPEPHIDHFQRYHLGNDVWR